MPISKHEREVASWEPKHQLEYERTRLRVLVAARIENLLDGLGLRKSDLAKRTNKSSAWVSKLLSGHQNLTLDTLAEIGWALGVRWNPQVCPAERENTPAAADAPFPEWVTRQSKIVVRHVAALGYSVAPVHSLDEIDMSASPSWYVDSSRHFFTSHFPSETKNQPSKSWRSIGFIGCPYEISMRQSNEVTVAVQTKIEVGD
jgi:transcriptional regulator with XRE-family HTH domain